ncbi:ABC transporter permease [Bacillus carboniphilus]|uniref:Transport permease protein n=1 Tax=Bacillus carboniphilus TaxID=86663 RepID=A0ABY9K2L4_9BACI|nr:ABC transporter permease [Bacillus carboniphilus]WLR44146.1 ABC transporter permease [Bacillus carboniphilus]
MAFLEIEIKALLREPISLFFLIVVPIILMIVFGGVFGDEQTHFGENVLGIDTVVPINIVFLLANVGLMGIPITILELKEQGVLKRYSTYPINMRNYFLSLMAAFSLFSIISTCLFMSLSFFVYGASYFMNLFETTIFILLYFLIIYIFYSIGFLLALFIKSSRTANLVSSGFFIALLFTSGIVLPIDSLPQYIQVIAKIFPMFHSVEVTQMLWISELSWSDSYPSILYLLLLGTGIFILFRNLKVKWEI